MRQNNPLLYIFIGLPGAWETVRDIQAKHVEIHGIEYLSIDESYSKKNFSAELRAVKGKFLTTAYSTPAEIKVAYAVNADSSVAPLLPAIKLDIEEYLRYLYPGGVLSDIFLFLDDIGESINTGRGTVIDTIANMYSDNCMTYAFSNVNSKRIHAPDAFESILCCIALLGIMKDFFSIAPLGQSEKFYNERYFRDDCTRFGGRFMTAGHLSIRRPVQIIEKILLLELLTYRKQPECDFEWRGYDMPSGDWIRIKENIYGLCMDANTALVQAQCSNIQILRALFGKRLDLFFELNFTPGPSDTGAQLINLYLQDCARDQDKGFYYIQALTAKDGALRRELKRLHMQATQRLKEIRKRANDWQNEQYKPSKQRRFSRVPESLYNLAEVYLKFKFELAQPELEISRIDEAIKFVDEYQQALEEKYSELLTFTKSLADEVRYLCLRSKLFFATGSLSDYYIECLREFIKSDDRFSEIYARMMHTIELSGVDAYTAELEQYISKVIMLNPAFNQSLADDLQRLYGNGDELYHKIWDFIISGRIFNISLKSGNMNLYSEITVFAADSELSRCISGVVRREKINFFYKEHGSSIDVIYHGGAFSRQDLYYDALYRAESLMWNGD